MYTEATIGEPSGKTAILLSPTLKWTSALTCVTFWYSMNGWKMGSLALEVGPAQGGQPRQTVWSRSGDQGPGWHKASLRVATPGDVQVSVNTRRGMFRSVSTHAGGCSGQCQHTPGDVQVSVNTRRGMFRSVSTHAGGCSGQCQHTPGDVQFRFVGTLGGFFSDMAIDDVKATSCGQSLRVIGHYAAVSPATDQRTKESRLTSPVLLTGQGSASLTFWCQVPRHAELAVFSLRGHSLDTRLWSDNGHQGQRSGQVKVNLTATQGHPLQVCFVATRGSSQRGGEVGVDDIEVTVMTPA
ncbi:hypothetical protein ACOMHN_053398 [Nucella lapillus]